MGNYDQFAAAVKEIAGGKNVVLLDDVLTTGESFRQLQRKMKQLGRCLLQGCFWERRCNLILLHI